MKGYWLIIILLGLFLLFVALFAYFLSSQPILDRFLGVEATGTCFLLLSSLIGGLISHLVNNRGSIIFPAREQVPALYSTPVKKLTNPFNIHLGVVYDILVGFGAGISILFLLDTRETGVHTLASIGFVAGFLGQSLIELVTDKVQEILGLKEAVKLGNSAQSEINAILEEIIGVLTNLENEKKLEKDFSDKASLINERISLLKDKTAKIETMLKSQTAILNGTAKGY